MTNTTFKWWVKNFPLFTSQHGLSDSPINEVKCPICKWESTLDDVETIDIKNHFETHPVELRALIGEYYGTEY